MQKSHLKSSAALAAALSTTWTFSAAAEQPVTDPTSPTATDPAMTSPAATSPDPVMTSTSTTRREPVMTSTPSTLREPAVSVGAERQTWPNRPLLATGTALLGATYGASVIVAGTSDRDSDDKLYYPVVGPWMSLSDRDCDVESCDNETLGTTLLIGSGVLQGVGALSMVMSLFIPETSTESWYLMGDEDFMVTPVAGTGEVGAAAIGRF